jgi:hypothetical protein
MESSKFGYWLQVSANIGILAGLILVGFQIAQSNSLTATQLFSDSIESQITRDLAVLGETPHLSMMRVMYEPEKATREDYVVADSLYMVIIRQLVRTELLAREGLYGGGRSGVSPEGFAGINYFLFGCPYGIAFLDQWIGPNSASSLQLMRDLAAENLMSVGQDKRIKASQRLMKTLAVSND